MKNGSLIITVVTQDIKTRKANLYLLNPWHYENSYVDPIVNSIQNDTMLRVGNIGYSIDGQLQEIIVFFEDQNCRLIRAVEFKTERPYADLAQLLHLFALPSVKIRYSSKMERTRFCNHIYLDESTDFGVCQ